MSRAHSRFIPGEEINTATEWSFGAVDQASLRFAAKLKAQAEAEELLKEVGLRQSGIEEGYTKGYAEGFAQGHAQATLEGQRQITDYIQTQGAEAAKNFGALFAMAESRLEESEQAIAKGALELACELSRQVLRHEISINPNAMLPVAREAIGILAIDNKAALVRINPVDLDVLADTLKREFPGLALNFVPDSAMTRGGCQVEAGGTVIDGTVERRWHRVVASLGLESTWEIIDDVR
jgi:flagellar assembly protein FliH